MGRDRKLPSSGALLRRLKGGVLSWRIHGTGKCIPGTQIRPLFWLVKALFLGGFTFKTRGHWGIYILTYLNGWFSWLMLNVCKYTPQDRRNFEYLWQENALGKSKFRDSVIFKNVFYGFLYSKMFFSLVVWTFLLGQAQVINPAHVSWMLFYTATLPCGPVNSAPLVGDPVEHSNRVLGDEF